MPASAHWKQAVPKLSTPSTETGQSVKAYPLIILINIGLAAAVFVLDISIPSGITTDMLYVVPVAWLALWSSKHESWLVVATAAVCTVLPLVGFFLAPPEVLWVGVVNHVIAIVMIWTTAVLSIMRKRAEEETKILRGLLPICSYCKKIRDDQGYWKQIEVYISANSQADFSHGVCPECGVRHYPNLFAERETLS